MKPRFLLLALCLCASVAHAQAGETCPELPQGEALGWEVVLGPDFVFCKAVRKSDGTQAFSVNLARDTGFRPNRALRDTDSVIDGHEVRWYRGEVATRQNIQVREAVVELGKRSNAHLVVRADSEQELAENRRMIEGLRFRSTSVGGD